MRDFVLAALLLAAGCSAPPYSPRFSPIDADGGRFRDGDGRTLLLRGVNVRVGGVFDVNFTDGRAPREIIPSFDSSDVAQLRSSGFNLIRLPINWSGIEPSPGNYDQGYLDQVAAVIDTCRGSGVYVLLDFHEDGWSKELCEDGAPLWAIDPPPAMLVGGPGPLAGPTDCHTATGALAAFKNFFAGTDGLEDAYVNMTRAVATRFAGDTQVMGYEVMNEPIGDDDAIAAFSARVGAALRAVDPNHLVVYEPSATRNFTNSSPLSSSRFSVDGAAYAVHVYNPGPDNAAYPTVIDGSMSNARDEADAWGTPLLITEFGAAASDAGAAWLSHFLDEADARGASTAQWLWKEESQGYWGLFTHQPDGSWTPRPTLFEATVRPYAPATGGDLDGETWDGSSLTVSFHGKGGVAPRHAIFWNRGTPAFSCDGAPVTPVSVDADASRYLVDCGGAGAHALVVTATGT
jgi:endoglycosylceramidase